MKYCFLLTLVCVMIIPLVSIAAVDQSPYVSGQLLVQMAEPNATPTTAADPSLDPSVMALVQDFEGIGLNADKYLSRRLNIWLFSFDPVTVAVENALAMVKSHPTVREAQFNHYVEQRQNMPDDPQFSQMWGLHNTGQTGGTPDADIDGPEAWDIATGGTTALDDEIIVAIIDSGFDLNHQDLPYWVNEDEIPNNGVDDDGNGYVDDYDGWNAYSSNGNIPSSTHGTHVAGTAAALGNNGIGVTGVNWDAKVMPIAGSSGTESVVVEAYGYVLEMRTRYNETDGAEGAFVVSTNASFGVDMGQPANFPLWCGIYDSLGVQGVLSCGATANANFNIDQVGDIPTACPSPYMVAVTNTTHNDQKNSGAAYGLTTIDLGAPGTSILSTVPGNGYSQLTGTSMATPHVTGVIALMYSAASSGLIQAYHNDPDEIAIVMRDFLFAGTDTLPSLEGITVTGGRLNAHKALVNVGGFATAAFEGIIADETTQEPLTEVTIWAENEDDENIVYETVSDSLGYYRLDVEPGLYSLHSIVMGYSHFHSDAFAIVDEETLVVDVELPYAGEEPLNLEATSELQGVVPLSWEPPLTGDPAEYHIYRRAGEDTVYQMIGTVTAQTQFDDVEVENGHGYFYTVTAFYLEPDGESFYSNEAFAIPGERVYLPHESDFETDEGGLYPVAIEEGEDGAIWSHGVIVPTHGPGEAASGDHLWGMGLDDNYANNADIYLLTPLIDLTTAVEPRLTFDHWYEFEATTAGQSVRGFDGGNVAISTDAGDNWIVLVPEDGYDDLGIPGLDQEPGFSGTTEEWQTEYFDLSEFAGWVVMLRFRVGSDAGFNMAGWFIDNLSVADALSIEAPDEETPTALRFDLGQNYPNPFNPTTTIAFQLPRKSTVQLTVYNVNGQRVKTLVAESLEAGQHHVSWDGTNDLGGSATSGVYFYTLTAGDQTATKRMVLLK